MSTMSSDYLQLLENDIPAGNKQLEDSSSSLEKMACYCENNYEQAKDKRQALVETRNFTTQSLASVAYQINTLATNFLQLLDYQVNHLKDIETSVEHVSQNIVVHKEVAARRDIGHLTYKKISTKVEGVRTPGIVYPSRVDRPTKYERKPIDYGLLDHIGHGKQQQQQQTQQQHPSSPPATSVTPNTPSTTVPATRRVSSKSKGPAPPPPNIAPPPAPPTGITTTTSAGGKPPPAPPPPVQAELAPQKTTPLAAPPPPPPPPPAPVPPAVTTGTGGPPPARPEKAQSGTAVLPPMPHRSRHEIRSSFGDLPLPPPPDPTSDGTESYDLDPPPPDFPMNLLRVSKYRGTIIIDHNSEENMDWIPKDYIEKVITIYDYGQNKADELTFTEGSTIYVLKKHDDGWWEGIVNGQTGLFPENYVEPCI